MEFSSRIFVVETLVAPWAPPQPVTEHGRRSHHARVLTLPYQCFYLRALRIALILPLCPARAPQLSCPHMPPTLCPSRECHSCPPPWSAFHITNCLAHLGATATIAACAPVYHWALLLVHTSCTLPHSHWRPLWDIFYASALEAW